MMRRMKPTLTAARVAVVSGKGGVGKTTVATALAVAAARRGREVLLTELEDREAFAPLFGLERLGYTEKPLDRNIRGMTVEADEALVEYLRVVYGIPKISRALIRSKAVEFATHTAPGLKDILLIGKVKQSESERVDGRFRHDMLIVDAPPTGRLPRFLDAPRAITELVGAGPIRRQAKGVADMIMDAARLQVILVTLPEEMPVQETLEAAETLRKMGVALGPVVVNSMVASPKRLGRDAADTLRRQAQDAGLGLGDDAIDALITVSRERARRARNQRSALRPLRDGIDLPIVELPALPAAGLTRAHVDQLADALKGSGAL